MKRPRTKPGKRNCAQSPQAHPGSKGRLLRAQATPTTKSTGTAIVGVYMVDWLHNWWLVDLLFKVITLIKEQ